MKAVIYEEKGKLSLGERPVPRILEKTDAIVRVTLASICTSDLHIKHGAVLKAKPGVVVGHEMARGPCDCQCGDLLRGVFFLQEGLCEQLYQ